MSKKVRSADVIYMIYLNWLILWLCPILQVEASPAGPGRSVQEVERGARQGTPSQHSGFFKMYQMVMIGHDWSQLDMIGHAWSRSWWAWSWWQRTPLQHSGTRQLQDQENKKKNNRACSESLIENQLLHNSQSNQSFGFFCHILRCEGGSPICWFCCYWERREYS